MDIVTITNKSRLFGNLQKVLRRNFHKLLTVIANTSEGSELSLSTIRETMSCNTGSARSLAKVLMDLSIVQASLTAWRVIAPDTAKILLQNGPNDSGVRLCENCGLEPPRDDRRICKSCRQGGGQYYTWLHYHKRVDSDESEQAFLARKRRRPKGVATAVAREDDESDSRKLIASLRREVSRLQSEIASYREVNALLCAELFEANEKIKKVRLIIV